MASHPPSRAASIADRRASASVRQQKSRPTASNVPSPTTEDGRTDSRSTYHNRLKTKTTETTTKDVLTRETLIRRTLSPTKKQFDGSNGRKSFDVERPSSSKEKSRREPEEAAGMLPVRLLGRAVYGSILIVGSTTMEPSCNATSTLICSTGLSHICSSCRGKSTCQYTATASE